MDKLIKPFKLTKQQLEHIIFVGTKEFSDKSPELPISENFCSLRKKDDVYKPYGVTMCLKCMRRCCICFYNANNYLNVLKYREKLLNEQSRKTQKKE